METMERITKREILAAIKETFETGSCPIDPAFVLEYCEKETNSLDTKAAKAKERAAAKKVEGDMLKARVFDALTTEAQTIADITAALAVEDPEVTPSKVTNRLGALVREGKVVKEQITIPASEGMKARKVQSYRIEG